jgi:hypothetical protein
MSCKQDIITIRENTNLALRNDTVVGQLRTTLLRNGQQISQAVQPDLTNLSLQNNTLVLQSVTGAVSQVPLPIAPEPLVDFVAGSVPGEFNYDLTVGATNIQQTVTDLTNLQGNPVPETIEWGQLELLSATGVPFNVRLGLSANVVEGELVISLVGDDQNGNIAVWSTITVPDLTELVAFGTVEEIPGGLDLTSVFGNVTTVPLSLSLEDGVLNLVSNGTVIASVLLDIVDDLDIAVVPEDGEDFGGFDFSSTLSTTEPGIRLGLEAEETEPGSYVLVLEGFTVNGVTLQQQPVTLATATLTDLTNLIINEEGNLVFTSATGLQSELSQILTNEAFEDVAEDTRGWEVEVTGQVDTETPVVIMQDSIADVSDLEAVAGGLEYSHPSAGSTTVPLTLAFDEVTDTLTLESNATTIASTLLPIPAAATISGTVTAEDTPDPGDLGTIGFAVNGTSATIEYDLNLTETGGVLTAEVLAAPAGDPPVIVASDSVTLPVPPTTITAEVTEVDDPVLGTIGFVVNGESAFVDYDIDTSFDVGTSELTTTLRAAPTGQPLEDVATDTTTIPIPVATIDATIAGGEITYEVGTTSATVEYELEVTDTDVTLNAAVAGDPLTPLVTAPLSTGLAAAVATSNTPIQYIPLDTTDPIVANNLNPEDGSYGGFDVVGQDITYNGPDNAHYRVTARIAATGSVAGTYLDVTMQYPGGNYPLILGEELNELAPVILLNSSIDVVLNNGDNINFAAFEYVGSIIPAPVPNSLQIVFARFA